MAKFTWKFSLSLALISLFAAANAKNLICDQYQCLRVPYDSTQLQAMQKYLLNNIASVDHPIQKITDGVTMQALPGAMIASPSNRYPGFSQDYIFNWLRDAAICTDELVSLYQQNKNAVNFSYFENYTHFLTIAFAQSPQLGQYNLGQPKFNIDGTIWEKAWARPQNDGAALTAITLIHIANIYLAQDQLARVKSQIMPLVKQTLAYIANHYQANSYGPWEEIKGQHFFNEMVQRKALIAGAALAEKLGDIKLANQYLRIVPKLNHLLKLHWYPDNQYYAETINQQFVKGGGLDSAVIIALVYGQTPSQALFALNNPKVLSTAYYVREAFENLYPINRFDRENQIGGPLIGRYPNDIYDGNLFKSGNPWTLNTAVFAEFYYQLAGIYLKQKYIEIAPLSVKFFRQINPAIKLKPGKILAGTPQFEMIVSNLISAGDAMLQAILHGSICYAKNDCYHLSEQLNRLSGKPVSAKDLSWSYAAFLSAAQARQKTLDLLKNR